MKLSEKQSLGLRTDRNIIVSAGAGAGKTSILTSRYLKLLDLGFKPSRILCLTFTKKAAEEMRYRIGKELLERLSQQTGETRNRTVNLMTDIARSPIVTFDSLFLSIYHDHASHYWQTPQLTIIDSVAKTEMLETIHQQFNKNLTEFGKSGNDLLFGSIRISSLTETVSELFKLDRFEHTIEIIKRLVKGSNDRYEIAGYDFQYRSGLHGCVLLTHLFEWFSENDTSAIKNWMMTYNQTVTPYFSDETIADITGNQIFFEVRQLIVHHRSNHLSDDSVFNRFYEFLSGNKGLLQKEIIEASGSLRFYMSHLITAFMNEYNSKKQEQSLADYHDIQNSVSLLLLKNYDLRLNMSQLYDHVLIDEFQDTNFSQWEIIRPFIWDEENNRLQKDKIFVVGDPKQSIFKFRNAQVEIFSFLERLIIQSNTYYHSSDVTQDYSGSVNLSENFRACESVLSFINSTFDSEFMIDSKNTKSEIQVSYQSMEFAKTFEDESAEQGWVRLIDHSEFSKEKAAADIIAELVENIKSNKLPFDTETDKIAVIASKNRVLQNISGQLKRIGFSHHMFTSGNVLNTQEGMDCTNFVKFLADPEHDITTLGILKSPFFLVADETLLIVKSINRDQSLCRLIQELNCEQLQVNDNERTKLLLFKEFSKAWLGQIVNEKVSHVLWDALTQTGAWSLYSEFFNSDVVIKNIESIIDHINQYEGTQPRTLHDIVLYLDNLSYEDSGLSEITGSGHSKSEVAVDLMTVHKSKGLTYKYVVVVNTFDEKSNTNTDPFLSDPLLGIGYKGLLENEWVETSFFKLLKQRNQQEEDAEKNRLVYVALTRSTHGMIILYDASVYSDKKDRRTWVNRFTDLTPVYRNIPDVSLEILQSKSVEHYTEKWIDHSSFNNKNEAKEFVEFIQQLKPESPETDSYFTNFTATGLMAANQCGTSNRFKKMSVFLSDNNKSKIFPSGLKGTIIHELMACHKDETKEIKVWNRFSHVPDDVRLEITETVGKMWKHPEIRNFSLQNGKHELSFFTTIRNRFIQGSIDWLIRNGEEATILDFKSNRISPSELEKLYFQYELQLKLYALAVSKIYPEIQTFHLNIFSTHILQSFQKTFSRVEIIDFEPALFHIILQIESKNFDRNFKETDHLLCTDCAFHSYCYQTEA